MRFPPVALAAVLLSSGAAKAQSTEEKFQDLFITAGYCTAFGAAVGTAFLAWTEDPTANLRYVAMGASLGFLGGSVLGSYIIFAPGLTDNSRPGEPGGSLLAHHASLPRQGLVLNPVYNVDTRKLASVAGGMTLLSF
jgi:drug/metabolite transporter (DMT)-like permease